MGQEECNEKLEEVELNPDIIEVKGRDDSALSKAIKKAKEAQAKEKSAVDHVADQVFSALLQFPLGRSKAAME